MSTYRKKRMLEMCWAQMCCKVLWVESNEERQTLEALKGSPNFDPKPSKKEKSGFFDRVREFFE